MILGLDIDGVMYDFVASAQRCASAMGLGIKPDAVTWSFPTEQWGMTWDYWAQFVAHATLGYKLFHSARMLHSLRRSLWDLAEDGHEIHYITHRHPLGKAAANAAVWQTEEWLSEAPGMLHVVKEPACKVPVAAKLGVQIMIEDNVDNAEAFLGAGIKCVLRDQPWNQHARLTIARYRDFGSFTRSIIDERLVAFTAEAPAEQEMAA